MVKESETVIKNKDAIFKEALNSIAVDNQSLRKSISNFLGNFSVILNKTQINNFLDLLIGKIKNSKDIGEKIAFLVTLNSVAKNTATKHGEFIKTVLPLIFSFCNRKYLEENMNEYDNNNDLVESGLNLLETYILNLSSSIKSDIDNIVKIVLELVEYDPNYSYDNETTDNYEGGDYEGYGEYEGYEAFVYGDDSSWKVRRAAVRVIQSFIKSRLEIPKSLTEDIIQNLVFNLREHEENTKLDIIACLSNFIRNLTIEEQESINNQTSTLVRQKSVTRAIIPMIIKNLIENIKKELDQKNSKIKISILQLLSSLALVAPEEIVESYSELKLKLEGVLTDNSSSLIFFVFLNRLLKSSKNINLIPVADTFLGYIIKGIKNDYYKINIESVNASSHFIRNLGEHYEVNEYSDYIKSLYKEFLPKFKANDIEQELKQSLINVFGNILLYTGVALPKENLNEIIVTLLDKIKNENLRPLVLNWLILILKNNSKLNLEESLKQFIPTILELLNKNNLHTQYQSLEFLLIIIKNMPKTLIGYEASIIDTLLNVSTEESLFPIIYDILNELNSNFNLDKSLVDKSLEHTIKFLSEQKQNNNFSYIYSFIQNCSEKIDQKNVNTYLQNLSKFETINSNTAVALSIFSVASGNDEKLVKLCLDKLNTKLEKNLKKNVLLVLGEIILKSKKHGSGIIVNLQKMLNDSNEELKPEIATCIGKVGFSDIKAFIESITKNIKSETLNYTLISIREFLNVATENKNLKFDNSDLEALFNILVSHAKTEDEKLRALCGECLGLMASLSEGILKEFLQNLENSNSVIRSTFYYGLKYIFTSRQHSQSINLDKYIQTIIERLIKGLNDSDITVKQNAFNSLTTLIHNYSYLARELYSTLWQIFREEHVIKPDLILTVDIGGGMKIKNDKGLPIRKAIFTTLKMLLETIPEKLNITETLQICLYGLGNILFNIL